MLNRKLQVTLFDKSLRRVGWVSDPVAVSVTERWLSQSTGEITVRATDPKLPLMLKPGAMVQVNVVTGDQPLFSSNLGYKIMLGRLRNPKGSFTPGGLVTFQIEDMWRVLRNFRVRPVPENLLEVGSLSDSGQSWDISGAPAVGEDDGRSGYYRWPAGPLTATQAASHLIDAQINARWNARFGANLLTLGSGVAGPDISSDLPLARFGTVESYIVPMLRSTPAALRFITDEYSSGEFRIVAEFWEPKTWPQTFTPDSGVVHDGEWSLAYPAATDVVAGGPGDLSARAFLGLTDLAASMEHQDIIEVFREATGAPVKWPTTLDEKFRIAKYYLLRPEISADEKAEFLKFLTDAATEALGDGAPTAGVTLQLSESEGFRFGGYNSDGFATGDLITVAPSSSTAFSDLTFTERITETTVTMSLTEGFSVTPQVGERRDDPDVQLARNVKALALANNRRNISQ